MTATEAPTTDLQPRMAHPAFVLPGLIEHLQAIGGAVGASGLPEATIELINMRASQINGCAVCLVGHVQAAKRNGETDERLAAVAGWREAPFYTPAERAALALTEALTRVADRAEPVPDELWDEVARHYDEQGLAALVVAIANINVWNRLNVATRQVAGAYQW
jgi:AhpD family alkylhydroperoxidase